nr:hypothetical protein [Arcticibacter svalbardensis]
MKVPPVVIDARNDIFSIIRIFDKSGTWYLPVNDSDARFLGFISKSAILTKYRQLLKDYS